MRTILIQTNSATTVTNSATAAANIQTAAHAITKLAADVGSALNIATAACYGTDIYKKSLTANSFIQETANNAEYAAQQAMKASYKSSEVVAQALTDIGTKSKTDLETLLTATKAQFETLANAKVADQQAIATASNTEKLSEGALQDADKELKAIDSSVTASNSQLNYSLTVAEVSVDATEYVMDTYKTKEGKTITKKDADGNELYKTDDKGTYQTQTTDTQCNALKATFTAYVPAFTDVPSPCKQQLGTTQQIVPDAFTDDNPQYYVFAVKSDEKSIIKQEKVDSLFSEFPPGAPKASTFSSDDDTTSEKPTQPRFALATTDGDLYSASLPLDGASAMLDIDGNAIELGTEYVVFMYAPLSLDFQKYLNVFSNILSSASAALTPTIQLPSPVESSITIDATSSTVTFDLAAAPGNEEYRVMLLPAQQPASGGLMVAKTTKDVDGVSVPVKNSKCLNFYFNDLIAEQISASNYTLATPDKSSTDTTKNTMTAAIVADTTDNFGTPLIEGYSYLAAVLTISTVNPDKYTSALAFGDTPVVIKPLDPPPSGDDGSGDNDSPSGSSPVVAIKTAAAAPAPAPAPAPAATPAPVAAAPAPAPAPAPAASSATRRPSGKQKTDSSTNSPKNK